MTDNKDSVSATEPTSNWLRRTAGIILLATAPFAVSPLNLRIGYSLRESWPTSVETFALLALLISLSIGWFAVVLIWRSVWWRVPAGILVMGVYGVLWFGNQLDYGCRLYMSCI